MAWTQTHLDAIEAAIATGTLKVSYDGKLVEYRSMDDLLKARLTIKAALDEAAGTAAPRVSFAGFSKGWAS